jgi:hypothetical protein
MLYFIHQYAVRCNFEFYNSDLRSLENKRTDMFSVSPSVFKFFLNRRESMNKDDRI